ncbi:hypothetical protein FAGAP_5893 [Fusarium agapanthi]|uniref:Uncharacterized protein n=1 Tax=Fusarium agapanthi TaxID=1803897 RepID=A0A9P5E6T2_9HYPO|nr:hypothetical protein FAGAP_5893 [Fusarium agapanthi]
MEELRDLKPGEVQFLSSYKPSLLPGDYRVDINQTVLSPSEKESRTLKTEKKFTVVGPSRYHLPAGSIQVVYPAEGDSVPSKTLPHVTLSDAHLPWELNPDKGNVIANEHVNGSLIPWIGLLVFTDDELKTLPPISPQPEVSSTLSVRLGKAQLKVLKPSSTQVPLTNDELDDSAEEKMDVIFINSDAFRAYFSAQMDDNKSETEPAIARYSYLSHIRRSRSTKAQDPTTSTFSIALGHRSGPLEFQSTKTVTAYAHLVSLMGVSDLKFPERGSPDLTALVSLYSWTFSWIAGDDAGVEKAIKDLSDNVRPLKRVFEQPVADDWLKRRLEAGYTLVKHRLQTGEQTFSLFRGPFIPQQPSGSELGNAEASGHGSGLQIIDRSTGIIDITYSAAWSLGRSLAIENSSFTTALSALRARITFLYRESSSSALMDGNTGSISKTTVPDWYQKLQQIAKDTGDPTQVSVSEDGSRWKRARNKLDGSKLETNMPGTNPDSGLEAVRNFLQEEVNILVEDKDWYARELVEPTQEGLYIAKVLDFIYNQLLTLRSVPHNYMFPEPDILDTEAVLTFYVDPLWVDTLVDGALSIGSHSTVDEDFVRHEIKRAINSYLLKVEVRYKHPRVPRWGALVCGSILSVFGDARIRTGSSVAASPQLLVNTKLHDKALLLVLNCRPSDLAEGLTISQPPHQQMYAVGTVLEKGRIRIDPVAATKDDGQRRQAKMNSITAYPGSGPRVFDFETRCLIPTGIMTEYMKQVATLGVEYLETGSSALLSFVLGDKLQEMTIRPTQDQADLGRERQLEPFQLSIKTRHGSADKFGLKSGQSLPSSSGSIPLGFRAQNENLAFVSVAATEQRKMSEVAPYQTKTTVVGVSETVQKSSLTSSCQVVRQQAMPDGTRSIDLTVTVSADKSDTIDAGKLRGIKVKLPLISLMDPTSKVFPTLTLFGSGSASWVSGCAYAAGDIPTFVVQEYLDGFRRYAPPTEISVLDAVCTAVQYASLFTKDLTPQPCRRFVYYNARALPMMDVYNSSTKWPNQVYHSSLKIREALRAIIVYGVSKGEYVPWVVQDFSYAESAVWGVNKRPNTASYEDATKGPVFEPYRLDSYQPEAMEAMEAMDELELRALGTSTLARVRLCLAEEYPVIFAFHFFWETFKTVGPAQSGDEGYPTIEKIPADRHFVGPRLDKNYDVQVGLIVGLDHRKRRILVRSTIENVEYFWMPYKWIIDVYATKSFWIIRNTGRKLSPPVMESVKTDTWCQKWDTLSPWVLKPIKNSATVSMAPNSSISVISREEGVLDMFWISEQGTIERTLENMKPFPGAIASVSVEKQKLDIFWMTASGAICNASTEVNDKSEPAVWAQTIVSGDGTAEPRAGLAATIVRKGILNGEDDISVYCVGPDGSIKHIRPPRGSEGDGKITTIAQAGSAYSYTNLSAVANYICRSPVLDWTEVVDWVTPDGSIDGKRRVIDRDWFDLWESRGESGLVWLNSRISAFLRYRDGTLTVYYVHNEERIYYDYDLISVQDNQPYKNHCEIDAIGEQGSKVRRDSDIKALSIGSQEKSKDMVLWQDEHGRLIMGYNGAIIQLSRDRGVRRGSPLGIALCSGIPVIGMKTGDGVISAGYWGVLPE